MSIVVGSIAEGVVSGITKFGAFVQIAPGKTGMVHISEVAEGFVKDINDHLKIGDKVQVKVLGIEGEKISLSIKKALPAQPAAIPQPEKRAPRQALGFEDMMSKFMKDSEERQTDIKKNARNKRSGYSRSRN